MNKNESQSGSAHLALVIILIIALVGALGFIFYQNFVVSKTSKPTPAVVDKKTDESIKTEAASDIALTEVASDQSASTNLALKYPKSWKMTHESVSLEKNTIVSEIYNIFSPDSKIDIEFIVSNVGGGGTCDKRDGDGLVYIDAGEIPNFSAARFIAYYGSDYYSAGIQPNNAETRSFKIGDSGCSMAIATRQGSIGPIANSGNFESVNLRINMKFADVGHDGVSSVEKFKEIIKTDDFKTAKRIIQSLYVKN